MKHYKITIEEIVSDTFDVVAENDEEAQELAIRKYNNGEFVLEPGNLVSKQMEVKW